MNRTVLCALAAAVFTTPLAAEQQHDRFGGCRALHFDLKNNGYFRTTFQAGQWWLVTPENNAFLSFGLNHFHSSLWVRDYNKEHWQHVFGGTAWSPKWKNAFHDHARALVTATGANTMAYHNEERILLDRDPLLPTIKQYIPVKISLHMNAKAQDYVDVFAPEFRGVCDAAAQEQVAPHVNDPMIIGFAMADIPVFTERWAKAVKGRGIPTWAMVLRNLPAEAPGKQKYVATMKARYTGIAAFNKTYGMDFASWDALATAQNWRPRTDVNNETEIADNNAFNRLAMKQYYATTEAAFRAVDSNHLFLGDKLNANVEPEELELMVDVAKDHVDVILYQFFGRGEYQKSVQNKIAAVSKLPMMNGDGGFGAYGDPKMPNPQFPRAKDQAQRAEWLKQYAADAFSNPNVVGWHICGVIDSWNTAPHGTQKPGIITPLGERHDEVFAALLEISNTLYDYRTTHNP